MAAGLELCAGSSVFPAVPPPSDMILKASFCCAVFATGVAVRAGPAETAIVEAMKLTDARNYSWMTDVVDDARSYTIEGKTDLADAKDLSLVTLPMPARTRRAPGRSGDTSQAQTTAIFKGDEKYVIETPDGWKRSDELSDPNGRYGGRRGGYGGYGGPGGYGGRGGNPRGGRTSSGDGGRTSSGEGGRSSFSLGNLPPTLSRPHEEIAIIVAGYTELKPEADGVSGTLSETNAKLLLVHAGQKDITPVRASGTFRLFLKEGQLVKYQVKLEGKLRIETRDGRREVDVHETATTTIRDVGLTKFDVPDAARKKLGA